MKQKQQQLNVSKYLFFLFNVYHWNCNRNIFFNLGEPQIAPSEPSAEVAAAQ